MFISHSSKDSWWAEEMARILKENGIRYWKAPESIPPGGNYNIEIPKGIERCPVFLVLLSQNAAESEYVPNELDLAKTVHKYIIPVQVAEYDLYVFKLALVNKQVYPWTDMDRIISQIRQQLRMPQAAVRRTQSASGTPQAKAAPQAAGTEPARAPQSGRPNFSAQPSRWIKWAAALCAVIVLLAAGSAALRGVFRQDAGQDTPGGDMDRNAVASGILPEGSEEGAKDATSSVSPDKTEEGAEAAVFSAPVPDSDLPAKLSKMHMMDAEMAEVKEEMVNSIGQTCEDVVYVGSYYSTGGNPHVQYYLGGEYGWFTGMLSCPDEMNSAPGYYWICRVYLDNEEDEPVYELQMDRSTVPTPISIYVSGCQTMLISVDVHDSGHNSGAVIVSDGLLYGKDADVSPGVAAGPSDAP